MHQRGFSRKKLRGGAIHQWIGGHVLARELWHLRKDTVARAWLCGVLVATSPFFGAHIVISLFVAVLVRANIPVTFVVQFITNPLTIPFYYPAAYVLGSWMLGESPRQISVLRDALQAGDGFWKLAYEFLKHGWMPLFLGCFVCGLVLALPGWLMIRVLWRDKSTVPPSPG